MVLASRGPEEWRTAFLAASYTSHGSNGDLQGIPLPDTLDLMLQKELQGYFGRIQSTSLPLALMDHCARSTWHNPYMLSSCHSHVS